jgi:hypothetical protein
MGIDLKVYLREQGSPCDLFTIRPRTPAGPMKSGWVLRKSLLGLSLAMAGLFDSPAASEALDPDYNPAYRRQDVPIREFPHVPIPGFLPLSDYLAWAPPHTGRIEDRRYMTSPLNPFLWAADRLSATRGYYISQSGG